MHAVAGMRAHRPHDERKDEIRCGFDQRFASHAERLRRENTGLVGETSAHTIARERHDHLRVVVDDGAGPVTQQNLHAFQDRQSGFGLADRQERDVVRGQIVELSGVCVDKSQPQLAVRSLQQKIERRIGHHVAGCHESQQPKPGPIAVHDAVVTLHSDGEPLQLKSFRDFSLAEKHEGEVHDGLGTRRLVRCALHRALPQA